MALAPALALASCGEPAPGEATEAWCAGYYVTNLVRGGQSIIYVSPQYLVDTSEGLGPQTLQLAIDRALTPQVLWNAQPGAQVQKDKVTRVLSQTLGFSLTQGTEFTASSAHDVPPGAYERLEAYPTFQSITFDVRLDGCSTQPDVLVAQGTVLRPLGVYFRVVTYDEGPVSTPPAPTDPGSPRSVLQRNTLTDPSHHHP